MKFTFKTKADAGNAIRLAAGAAAGAEKVHSPKAGALRAKVNAEIAYAKHKWPPMKA